VAFENILLEKKDGVAKVTMNRPQALNAISPQVLLELEEAFKDIEKDDTVGVAVLTGAGRAFSAGVDIKGMDETRKESSAATRKRLALDVIETMEGMSKPIIAQVNGYCLTGALELATACDMIVAAENATFGDTHARWGLTPTWGGSQRLPRLLGALKAKEMVFTCDMLSAQQAERIGLINRVVPQDKLEETVMELAKKILANSRRSIAIQKSLMNRGLKLDYQSGLKLSEAESPGATEDTEARIKAFKEKTWDKEAAKKGRSE